MKENSIKINALLNMVYTISNIIFPLLTFPYVSRILLADGMGKISFFTAIANYAIMIASLGISVYGIRATSNVRYNKKKLSKTTIELFLINLIMTIIVILTLLLLSFFVKKINSDKQLFYVYCILIFFSVFGMNWLYSGLEQYSYITKRSIAFKCLSLIFVFLFVHQKSDYVIYALIIVFSTTGSNILNFFYSKRFISFKNIKKLEIKKHIKPMIFLFTSILAVNIYTNLDTVMLGFICNDKEVGLYTIAVKIKGLLLSVVNAISSVLLPRLSYYLNKNLIDEFNRILKKSISIIFMISLPLTIFFIIEAKDSVLLLGGSDYINAALCMQIIMPILLISGFSNIIGNQILIPMGKDSYFMKAVLAGSIVDLLFNTILMSKFGSIGAAVATLVAECIQMSIQLCFAWNYIIKNIQVKSIIKIIISTIFSIIVIIIKNIVFTKLNNTNYFLNLLFTAILFFLTFGIIMIFLKEKYCLELIDGFGKYLKKNN